MAQFTINTAARNSTGNRETFTFKCHDNGGPVRFSGGSLDGKQVCQHLYTLGYTLSASAATLPNVIRRELASRRRANALGNA